MTLKAIDTTQDLVRLELQKAIESHAVNKYTHIVVQMYKVDGFTRTTGLFYAPNMRVSEIIGLMETAKMDMYGGAQ